MTREFAMNVARGSGLTVDEANALLDSSPLDVLKKIGVSYP